VVGKGDDRGLAAPPDRRAFELQLALLFVGRKLRLGLFQGEEHRVAEMRARHRVAEDLGEKLALLFLEAFLFLERQARFGLQLRSGR
jgi:hypothetical protein